MNRKLKSWTAAWLWVPLAIVLVLSTGCGGSQSTPAQPEEPTATQPEEPTATQPAAPTATEAPTLTVAPSDTPGATAESTEAGTSGKETTYRVPVKGSESASVTLIEFSDYL